MKAGDPQRDESIASAARQSIIVAALDTPPRTGWLRVRRRRVGERATAKRGVTSKRSKRRRSETRAHFAHREHSDRPS